MGSEESATSIRPLPVLGLKIRLALERRIWNQICKPIDKHPRCAKCRFIAPMMVGFKKIARDQLGRSRECGDQIECLDSFRSQLRRNPTCQPIRIPRHPARRKAVSIPIDLARSQGPKERYSVGLAPRGLLANSIGDQSRHVIARRIKGISKHPIGIAHSLVAETTTRQTAIGAVQVDAKAFQWEPLRQL